VLAAAIATCKTHKGISCILGTGTNTCYFDGLNIIKNVPSLGYVLSDEASGNYFGRILCRDFFYEIMPLDLRQKFEEKYNITTKVLLDNVYHKPAPNTYLATFSPFLSLHQSHPYIQQILAKGFTDFFELLITKYDNYQELPIHFVGSIAANFKDELTKVASNFGCKIDRVLQHPIDALFQFHLQ
jgi:N-acetylglucosamine kinase-like BadF-type ATPase